MDDNLFALYDLFDAQDAPWDGDLGLDDMAEDEVLDFSDKLSDETPNLDELFNHESLETEEDGNLAVADEPYSLDEVQEELPYFEAIEPLEALEPVVEGNIAWSPDDIFQEVDDWWHDLIDFDEKLIYPSQFESDGGVVRDPQNGCIVMGNVADDIHYVDTQTAGSCSLMAQEQFVHRATGKSIPEDYLEWRAEQWGVYDPVAGTNYNGQTKILDHFDIDYKRSMFASLEDLDNVTTDGNDAIIGVDARYFYNDVSIPEGSGHAVAVVGKGVDPVSGGTTGYYITDSNNPSAARFLTSEELQDCWEGDMIAIPDQKIA
jgi:hypothetical protein